MDRRALEEGEWSDIVVVHPNGLYEAHNCPPKLKNLQTLVGGYIEVVPGFNKYGRIPCIVLANEDGKLQNQPYNNRATIEWGKSNVKAPLDYLVGPVAVLSGEAKRAFEKD